MPAVSKAQQKAAGAALSAKRGETKKAELKGASAAVAETLRQTRAAVNVELALVTMFLSLQALGAGQLKLARSG